MKYNWRLDISDIKSLYNKGYSLQEVGKMVGATRQAVWGIMKSHNIERRRKKILPFIVYDNQKWTITNTTGYYRKTTDRFHHISLHRYVYEKEVGKIPIGYDIHHIDNDKTNNKITNLDCLPKADHTRLHSPHHNQYKNNKTKHLYEDRTNKTPIFKKSKDKVL